MNATLEAIFSRRSIRKYEEKPVPKDLLLQLLQAGMAAPSAHNGKPWEFVVVTDSAVMDDLRASLEYGKHNAPAAIAVCYNPAISSSPSSKRWWVQDCAAALENMLIAAPSLGLGAVWVGVYPKLDSVKPVCRILALPPEIIPFGLVYTGYPAATKPPRTQFEEKRVHWEHF
jgi:nitroreductase